MQASNHRGDDNMRTKLAIAFASASMALVLPNFPASADQSDSDDQAVIAMATGGQSGTYWTIGSNVSQVLELIKSPVGVEVRPSTGTFESLEKLHNGEVQMAIVQSDLLSEMRNSSLEKYRNWYDNTRLVFSLYGEEVHVVARTDKFNSFLDLDGKRVAVGAQTSGSAHTASVLEGIAGIKFERRFLSGNDAVSALLSDRDDAVDAMIYVAGAPVNLFEELEALTDVNNSPTLEFIPIVSETIHTDPRYLSTRIKGSQYNHLLASSDIETVAVPAALVTYKYREGGDACSYVGSVAKGIWDYLEALQGGDNHNKWREVDLNSSIAGVNISPCVWNEDIGMPTSPGNGKDLPPPVSILNIDCTPLECPEKYD